MQKINAGLLYSEPFNVMLIKISARWIFSVKSLRGFLYQQILESLFISILIF